PAVRGEVDDLRPQAELVGTGGVLADVDEQLPAADGVLSDELVRGEGLRGVLPLGPGELQAAGDDGEEVVLVGEPSDLLGQHVGDDDVAVELVAALETGELGEVR